MKEILSLGANLLTICALAIGGYQFFSSKLNSLEQTDKSIKDRVTELEQSVALLEKNKDVFIHPAYKEKTTSKSNDIINAKTFKEILRSDDFSKLFDANVKLDDPIEKYQYGNRLKISLKGCQYSQEHIVCSIDWLLEGESIEISIFKQIRLIDERGRDYALYAMQFGEDKLSGNNNSLEKDMPNQVTRNLWIVFSNVTPQPTKASWP